MQSIAQHQPIKRVAAVRCAHCGRTLSTGFGTYIEHLGVVGPECEKKFGHINALLAQVPALSFKMDDQASQRLCHAIYSRLHNMGFEVSKQSDFATRTLSIVVSSKPARRKGDDVVKRYEVMRAEFERDLQIAAGALA